MITNGPHREGRWKARKAALMWATSRERDTL